MANDGLFVAGRNAMLALDSAIRSMPGAPEWVDANPLRNQFLAIARMCRGVQLDDQTTCNCTHSMWIWLGAMVEWKHAGGDTQSESCISTRVVVLSTLSGSGS